MLVISCLNANHSCLRKIPSGLLLLFKTRGKSCHRLVMARKERPQTNKILRQFVVLQRITDEAAWIYGI